LVDNRNTKEEGHKLIREASVLIMLAGDTEPQANFFAKYDLSAPIKETNANITLGFSAGAMNMAYKGVSAKYEAENTTIHHGLGLDNFCYVPYFLPDMNDLVRNHLLPLSKEIDVYATSPEGFIRVQGDEVTTFGDVYLISNSQVNKMDTP